MLEFVQTPLRLALLQLGVSKSCIKSVVYNFEVTNLPCIQELVAALLAPAIVFFSSIVKIPQIIKLLKVKQSSDQSLLSFLFDTFAYSITIGYCLGHNLKFLSYGESVPLLFQTLFLFFLVLVYRSKKTFAFFATLFLSSLHVVLLSQYHNVALFEQLQGFVLVLSLLSRLFQVVKIFSKRSTQSLSFITTLLMCAGGFARLFTLLSTSDLYIIAPNLLGCCFNLILLVLCVAFKKRSKSEKQE
ncbi:hypothetical protein RCL1_008205 [Eukaryota sp. TZLM3-RCL]